MNRQTLTYEGLSKLMYGKPAAGVLSHVLGHVAYHCIDQKLPPLTSIVVGKARGTPGEEIPIELDHVDRDRESVYGFDWYDVFPPSEQELAAVYSRVKSGTPSQPT